MAGMTDRMRMGGVSLAKPALYIVLLVAALACQLPETSAAADGSTSGSGQSGITSRLKGAPSTVAPYKPDPSPIYRPNCHYIYERHSDPNEGWTTRRVQVCD